MEFGIYWISLGILLIIIEIFLLTLDFLALGLAAIITGIFVVIFDLGFEEWWITGIIFLFSGVINIILFKKFLFPYIKSSIKEKSPLSADNFQGQKEIVQIVNGQKVVFCDGSYWTVVSDDEINQGDTVEIQNMEGGGFRVKKVY